MLDLPKFANINAGCFYFVNGVLLSTCYEGQFSDISNMFRASLHLTARAQSVDFSQRQRTYLNRKV